MGYEWGHSARAHSGKLKAANGKWEEDKASNMGGCSFSVPMVGFFTSQFLAKQGVLKGIATVAQCWGKPTTEARCCAEAVVGNASPEFPGFSRIEQAGAELLARNAIFKGRDVRMATSTLLNPAAWPRRGFPANWWTWKTIFAYRREGPHINVLKLDAIVVAVK